MGFWPGKMRKNERIFVFSTEKWIFEKEYCQRLLIVPITILGCQGMALGGEVALLAGAKKWTIAKNTC